MTLTAPAARYDRWKAPAEDGQTLIWPAPPDLLRETLDNQRRLESAESVRLQNISLPEVRLRMREWLGHTDNSQPIVATGHQAELHHPGVWVKNVLIGAAAERLGGRAMHFAVDTDEPKHLSLRWPGGSAPLHDNAPANAAWSGLLPSPTPGHLREVQEAFSRAARQWDFQPLVPEFLQSLQGLALESPALPAALTNAVHALDWSLGLRHDALLASPICLSEPYLVFVHHVLARAGAFASAYNGALEAFRKENKIHSPGRPMPNLKCVPAASHAANSEARGSVAIECEAPFWLDDLTRGVRTRAAVVSETGGAGYSLRLADGDRFVFDPRADGWEATGRLMLFCRRNGIRLAPRALTLTAVLRLLVADQFVHGIGGGQYDQVLDKLIAAYFKLDPPRFSVTTATLYFPSAAGQGRVCVACVAQEGRRLRHSLLGEEKQKLVEAIAAAPRNSAERSELFYQLHDRLAAARGLPQYRQWEDRYKQALAREREQRGIFDRELFYAIQPAERLQWIIAKVREAFAS